MNHPRALRGFTLIELIVVILILGVLAAVAVIGYNTATERANGAAAVSDLRQLTTAVVVEHTQRRAPALSRDVVVDALDEVSVDVDVTPLLSAAAGWTLYGPAYAPGERGQFAIGFDNGESTPVTATGGTRAVIITSDAKRSYARIIVFGKSHGQDPLGPAGQVPPGSSPQDVLDGTVDITPDADSTPDPAPGPGSPGGPGAGGPGSGEESTENFGVMYGTLWYYYSEESYDEEYDETSPESLQVSWSRSGIQLTDNPDPSSDELVCTSPAVPEPVPAEDGTWFVLNPSGPADVTCTVRIHDTTGKVVAQHSATLNEANSDVPVDTRPERGPAPQVSDVTWDGEVLHLTFAEPLVGAETVYARLYQDGVEITGGMRTALDPRQPITSLDFGQLVLTNGDYEVRAELYYSSGYPLRLYRDQTSLWSTAVPLKITNGNWP